MGDLLVHASWVRRIAADLVEADRAEDVAQDVWLTSIRCPPADRSSPRGWLRTVVTNLVRSGYRSERRRVARETAVGVAEVSAANDSPEDLTIRLQMQRRLAEQILALREPYRQAVVYRYVDDLSAAEIARILRLPPGTVRRRIKVGLDLLREALAEQFPDRERLARLLVPLAAGQAPLRLVPPAGPAPAAPAEPSPSSPVAIGPGKLALLGALLALPLVLVAVLRWTGRAPDASQGDGQAAAATGAALRSPPVFTPPARPQPENGTDGQGDGVAAGEPRDPAALDGAPVTGRVLDTHGRPLPEATVAAWAAHDRGVGQRQVRADDQGWYRLPLPAGRYILWASSPGRTTATTWVDLRGPRQLDLHLHLRARVSGRVVERATGQPLPGGTVIVSSRQARTTTAEVDASGAFTLEVGAGEYRVSARRGPLYGRSPPVQAAPGQVASVVVEVERTAAVHGRVTSEEGGAGLEGVTVSARPAPGERNCRGFQATATTVAGGSYRLEGLARCALSLEFAGARHVRRSVGVEAPMDDVDRRLDTALAAASLVAGVVRDAAGAAVAGAQVHVRAGGANGRVTRVTTDEQGRFEVDHLPPGEDVWLVAHHQRGAASLGPERLTAGETRRLTIALGTAAWIAGRVARPDGAPVAGFSVEAVPVRDGEALGAPVVAVTGDDGRFRVGPLAAGAVSLGAVGPWFIAARGPTAGVRPLLFTVASGEQRSGVLLTAGAPAGAVHGTVSDSAGRPVAGAIIDVYLESADGRRSEFETRAFSDEAGRFELNDLPDGIRRLVVEHPSHGGAARSSVRPGNRAVTLRLAPAAGAAGPR